MKTPNKLFILILLTFYCGFALSQDISKIGGEQRLVSGAEPTQTIRIDIARGGLHCPILGPQLKSQISRLESAEKVYLNTQESYLTFTISLTNPVTSEELTKLASDLGYPKEDIKITFSQKKKDTPD